jgi:Asp-tRNA(Asn)/Glu-tRNA(Gln) amidotransferase B subunit
MYEVHEKTRDLVIELFMKIDGRIEYAIEQIIEDKNVSEEDIERLIIDKELLLEIFEGKTEKSKKIQYDNVWSANNLINKIDYILDLNNKI